MSKRNVAEILFEDPAILVVNKSPGILSIPGRDGAQPSLLIQLRLLHNALYVVHRLDRDTSGVLLFAKDPDAHRELNRQFAAQTVEKTYLALVMGHPANDQFIIESRLQYTNQGTAVIASRGKSAVTECIVRERFVAHALIEARPRTGRMHQIRVHLAHKGLPIVADPLYGSGEPLHIGIIKKRRVHISPDQEIVPLMQRTALHAQQLCFTHPEHQSRHCMEAPLPRDFRAALQQLRKWSSR